MTVKNSKKADLRPFNVKLSFRLRFQDVQDDAYSVFVVLTNDSLICICRVRLNYPTFLLAGLCWLVIFKKNSFWIKHWWVLAKQKLLNLYKLNIFILFYFF